jgi:acyl-CoA synthetase (AMP-forming)/AMP-acid ligase II
MENFVEVLELHAEKTPAQTVFQFLNDQGQELSALNYRELQKKAQAIAAVLQKKFGKKTLGLRALLLYEPGLDFISALMGCFYAGVIAVPAYENLKTAAKIAKDSGAAVILTESETAPKLKAARLKTPALFFKPILATDQISLNLASQWHMPLLKGDQTALLQYTSGSTAEPRGVMVTHQNLLHNSKLIKEFYGHDQNSTGVIWLPFYHDMGLIGGLLQTLYLGTQTWLISPKSFIKSPYLWLKLISEKKATTSGGPNFAYELCMKGITASQKKNLDLSHWQVAFTGAEPIRLETINQFSEFFLECGFRKEAFYPCYGLAEATLMVTGGKKLSPLRTTSLAGSFYVSCGTCHPEQSLEIVDPHQKMRLAEKTIGEVWIAGPSIAKGYWRQKKLSQEVFEAYTVDQKGPFLRTGDLGFLNQGHLYLTGRIKELMIINGKNYYPQDIENTVYQNAPWVRTGGAAAFSIASVLGAGEKLVLAVEVKPLKINKKTIAELTQKLNKVLWAEHQLRPQEIILVDPRSLPKTSSGKPQRYLVKKNYQENKLNKLLL